MGAASTALDLFINVCKQVIRGVTRALGDCESRQFNCVLEPVFGTQDSDVGALPMPTRRRERRAGASETKCSVQRRERLAGASETKSSRLLLQTLPPPNSLPPHCAPPGGDGGSPAASGGVQRRPSAVARVGEEPRASPAPTARQLGHAIPLAHAWS